MNINIYIAIRNFKQIFFFCEKHKNFAGIKFSRSGHFEYFLKLFLYFFS